MSGTPNLHGFGSERWPPAWTPSPNCAAPGQQSYASIAPVNNQIDVQYRSGFAVPDALDELSAAWC